MKNRRTSKIIMTNEARVLKAMRLAKGLSMRKAGELIGVSDSYIAHLETGRMDVPQGEKLQKILDVYGPVKIKSFYERVRMHQHIITAKDQLLELVERLQPEQIEVLLKVGKGFLS